MRGFKAKTQEALSAVPGPYRANNGGHDKISTVRGVLVVVTIIITGGFHAPASGTKDRAAGWKAPADPPWAPLLPRRPRAAGALKSQSGK